MWKEKNGKIEKEVQCKNFVEALYLVNKIAEVAELLSHHPDISIHSYNKVKLTLYTHDARSITKKDKEMAKIIDNLIAWLHT